MSLETLALVSAGVGAAGALVSGVSQVGQARRQEAVADANAKEAENQGAAEADLIRERARRQRATNIANIGASGVDISGSFADALADSDISAELDAQTAVRNSKMQANGFRAQGKAARDSIAPTAIGTAIGAGTQALSGYGNWRLLKSMGGPSAAPNGWMGTQVGAF